MNDHREILSAIEAEHARLGLDVDTSLYNGLAGTEEGIRRFLEHLRSLKPGATWRDVHPNLPSHWVIGQPETYTYPYKPLGLYDYQELPTSPAFGITWKEGGDEALDRFLDLARDKGWPIYGAGIAVKPNERWTTWIAHIVMQRETSEDTVGEMVLWIEDLPGYDVAGYLRDGTEKYHVPDPA